MGLARVSGTFTHSGPYDNAMCVQYSSIVPASDVDRERTIWDNRTRKHC